MSTARELNDNLFAVRMAISSLESCHDNEVANEARILRKWLAEVQTPVKNPRLEERATVMTMFRLSLGTIKRRVDTDYKISIIKPEENEVPKWTAALKYNQEMEMVDSVEGSK